MRIKSNELCIGWSRLFLWIYTDVVSMRVGRFHMILKSPKARAFFSERNGCYLFRLPVGKGWRIIGNLDKV